jgi:HK97 family phage major capsid protein
MTEVLDEVRAQLGRIRNDVQTRVGALDTKQIELQSRLQECEQLLARRGSSGGSASSSRAGSFSAAADDLLAGLRGTNSSRVALDISIKAALSDVDHEFPPQPLQPVSGYAPSLARLLDLLPAQEVKGNTLMYLRVGYATDSPEGNRAAPVAELAAKPESHVVATPITTEIRTWAHWIECSKQLLDDQTELRAVLDGILRGGLLDKIDLGIFDTLTTSGNFTVFTPVSGETVGDAIARIAAQVANAGGTNVAVALNPADFLSMTLTKADTSGTYLGVPANLASRVASTPAVAAGSLLAFAPGSGAAWADRQGVNVTAGLKADQFVRNSLTLLCEARGEVMVRNPNHIAYGNVTAA